MGIPGYDVAIIGGGVVGMATAMTLADGGRRRVVVFEAEDRLAAHQTGHNSGVIHSGLYYRPGSLKARNCVEGRTALIAFCEEAGVPFELCGKVVVAVDDSQVSALDELERRGHANGIPGMRRLGPEAIRELEPNVAGVAGLSVPGTGIIDYQAVVEAYARRLRGEGGEIRLQARVTAARREGTEWILESRAGAARARALVNCAGLQCDRVARLCGARPGLRIVPFRGEYYELVPEKWGLIRNLVYPVPDPRFPFLGVHFTRMIGGGVEAGPNAVLAFRREGYRRWDVSARDMLDYLSYPGFWKMSAKYWQTGMGEWHRSLSKRAFIAALRRLAPGLEEADAHPGGAGVRAQALLPDGRLCDDFQILEGERMVHVLNAPSPAATASLSIARTIADRVVQNCEL